MTRGEILSPAGSMESVVAGVRSGSDAVYLGVSSFNARRNAKNFSFDELEEAVKYCHERGVRVHLTLNTLVSDGEIIEALKTAQKAVRCGVDAIIIQDVGLAKLIKESMPSLPLHASTQMSVQTKYGIDFLENFGFSRAVLPRELSKDEILSLLKTSNIELEMFVHGALCMCVSGQCYLSSMIGQRSGNRGLCAQPCRLPFSANGETRYDLSLKDNSLVDYLKEMSDAGIVSFKIEGRMKRPEYVAAAVKSCKNALFLKDDPLLRKNLKNVFSRSGFTDGYFKGELGKEMFGIRAKTDVENSHTALKDLQKIYEKEVGKFPIDFYLKIKCGEKIFVKVSSCGAEESFESDFLCEKASSKSLTLEDVRKQFEKLGNTQFYLVNFDCEIDESVYVGMSALNALRRQAVELTVKRISRKAEIEINDVSVKEKERHIAKNRKFYYIFKSENQIPDYLSDEEIFLPAFTNNSALLKYKNCGVAMPRGIMHNSEKIYERMKELKDIGIKKALCMNIDTLEIASRLGFETVLGFSANIYNSESLEFFSSKGANECTLSIEMSKQDILNIKGKEKRGIVAYGKIPLMLTRNCPIKNIRSCKECQKKSHLTDRMGVSFDVMCENGFSEVFNSVPIYLFDKIDEFFNVDFFILNFTTEAKEDVEKVIEMLQRKAPPGSLKFTRGLYYRKTE